MVNALSYKQSITDSLFLPAYQKLPQDLLDRLYIGECPTKAYKGIEYFAWRAAIDEVSILIGITDYLKYRSCDGYETQRDTANKTIDWLDHYYPMWRGYTW